jgi:hypothetical protein
VLVAGATQSPDFPVHPGYEMTLDSSWPDGFIARLTGDLSQLEYGSYLGGSAEDRPPVVGLDLEGRAYAAGFTDSPDFPTTPGAFDRTYYGGTSDAFISWIDAGAAGSLIFADGFEGGSMGRWLAP